ncbi:hypothetical protein CANINC_004948 [Pichia inconspicua]|uniref:Zinc/iron permease n=1 Tax=Pichia inconspicua TaxID=52247 RepID=A0A4T0WUG7_9ASCO|nr:hypothetical protein CANINC_004948 [[Candida] inconspicua]
MDQGWFLVLLTSAITLLGCLSIYVDVIYAALFPKRAAEKPFNIVHDTAFLVAALALSAGSLMFTSLYKLLPKAHENLYNVPSLAAQPIRLKLVEFSCYFAGIAICSSLNTLIHFFTSESLVHCVHGDSEHHHSHDQTTEEHSHSHGNDHDHNQLDDHSHSHAGNAINDKNNDINGRTDPPPGYTEHPRMPAPAPAPAPAPSPATHHFVCPRQPLDANANNLPHSNSDIAGCTPRKVMSFTDLSLKTLRGETFKGRCYGNLDCCFDLIRNRNGHPSDFNTHTLAQPASLHFCTHPSGENAIFIDDVDGTLLSDRSKLLRKYPTVDISSPLLSGDDEGRSYGTDSDCQHTSSSVNEHTTDIEEFEHHHHIKTPLSRLLSIGVQTILAITLHKFPEGFIMYSTSKTEPELGLSIFLSLFIHNFVEGFTMTLPLYMALRSRGKAILCSGSLGAFSQPLGALAGYLTFRGALDENSPKAALLQASLLALTSGFLTFISLQMLTSAIGFGGKQETVLGWTFFGILLIALSNLLLAT